MSIAQRLMLLIACGAGALLLLSGVNFMQMNNVFNKANYGNENTVPSILALDRALLELGHLRVRTYRHVLVHDAAQMTDIDNKIQAARNAMAQAFKDYESLISNDEDKHLLDVERTAFADYAKAVDEIIADSRSNRKDEARELLVKYGAVAEKVNDDLVAHMKFNEDLGKKASLDAVAAKQNATWIAALVFLFTLGVLSAFGWATSRSLTARVDEANRLAERIARGDLSRTVSAGGAGNDEIGRLLASLDKMRDDLGRTIGEIVSGAEAVASSSTQLSTAAQQVAASSDSQSQSTSSAAAAVEQLTVSIDHVGGSADESSLRAKDAETKAVASGHDVEHASGQIAEVASRVEHSAQQIQTLSQQVQQINNITVVIREVADQTNLLALNAAIEAARAGEQGRGFAVVADEVRKLAERTTSSVQEIASMINTIQDGAVLAVNSMQSSRQVVNEVVATAGRASASMHDIRASAETVQKSIAGISDALREQRSASVELSRNVETIAQMSEENSSAVSSVARTANDLVTVADRLKQSVARFRL